MKKLTVEETKKSELDILTDVAKFCEQHGLNYFLAYGTLIGAVRHKGFIPWDDDIDIQMPRKDYETFLKIYKNDFYEVINPYDRKAKHSFAKVIDKRTVKIECGMSYKHNEHLGVDIDIFPLDGQPDDEDVFVDFYKEKMKIYKTFNYSLIPFFNRTLKGMVKNFIPTFFVRYVYGKNYFLKKAEKVNEKYTYEDSKYVGTTSSIYNSENNRFLKDWYNDFCYLEFENMKFKAPVGYNEILTKMYGNYMELPPKEKQITHHVNEVYWLEEGEGYEKV